MKRNRVYAIMNRKGGVGKTTTAVNLAAGLAQKLQGKGHVLIVDLDPQANVSTSLGLNIGDGPTIADLLLDDASVREVSYRAGDADGQRGNLWVIPSDDELQIAKEELIIEIGIKAAISSQSNRRRRKSRDRKTLLSATMQDALKAFDFILLDCPPSLDILREAVFDFAEAAVVPVKPDYLGSAGTVQHTRNILAAQADGFDIKIEWFVPTFYRNREVLANQMVTSLRETYGRHLVSEPIPQAVVLERAPAEGQTIFEYAPDSKAAEAYASLANRVWSN